MRFSWLKLLLSLLILISAVGIGIVGFYTFTRLLEPIVGSISFIATVALFIYFVIILQRRSMRHSNPKFVWVLLSAFGILLVCAFAGVQPISSYKDQAFLAISSNIPVSNNSVRSTTTNNLGSSSNSLSWVNIPEGYYESDLSLANRTIEIHGLTLTMYSKSLTQTSDLARNITWPPKFPQLGIHTYEYKLHTGKQSNQEPSTPTNLDNSNLIYLRDIVSGYTIDIRFRYIPEYKIIVLVNEEDKDESFRLKAK
jgi:hypothetical protein